MKLTKKEQKESMFNTWGRIRSIAGVTNYGKAFLDLDRLELLIEKFNKDMAKARIIENYFGKGGEFEEMCKQEINK